MKFMKGDNSAEGEKKKDKFLGNKRRKKEKQCIGKADIGNIDQLGSEDVGYSNKVSEDNSKKAGGKKKKKLMGKKKSKTEQESKADASQIDCLGSEDEDYSNKQNDTSHSIESSQSDIQRVTENSAGPEEPDIATYKTHKSKKAIKKKKTDHRSSKKGDKSLENGGDVKSSTVYHISSGDEDCSKGMKKWIMEYNQSRPGLKILQQRIDEFITTHEAQEEQAKNEREARAAEGGWTVVVHHKGRKKTTDSESGITVGSVAQAAVVDRMAKKKNKEVGLDFYRFHKKEAHRNEVLMLQSKFEQDKKRIQQLRAARKFRPY